MNECYTQNTLLRQGIFALQKNSESAKQNIYTVKVSRMRPNVVS